VIELLLNQRPRRLGSFEVGRVLPAAKRRMIGPFIFFDHMGLRARVELQFSASSSKESLIPKRCLYLSSISIWLEERDDSS